MENRRRYYRYVFPVTSRPTARLECPDWPTPLIGEVVDLSGGGMLVYLRDRTAPLPVRQAVTVHCPLPNGGPNLVLVSEVVHCRVQADGVYCGIHFVPDERPQAQDQRVSMLLHFIADEQRRQLRHCPMWAEVQSLITEPACQ